MFWKVYFVVYLALALFGVARYTDGVSHHTATEWLDLLAFTPLAAFALFARAYRWPPLPRNAWRTLFAASLAWVAFSLRVGVTNVSADRRAADSGALLGGILIALLPALPVLLGLYQLSVGRAVQDGVLNDALSARKRAIR